MLTAAIAALGTAALLGRASGQQTCPLTVVPSGFAALIGGYRPFPLPLSTTKPEWVKEAPTGMSAPQYASLNYLGKHYTFALSRGEDGKTSIVFDANGNGSFSDDPAVDWTGRSYKTMSKAEPAKELQLMQYMGSASLDLPVGSKISKVSIGVYAFDPRDPGRASVSGSLFVYNDFGFKTTVAFGSQKFPVFLGDSGFTGFSSANQGMKSVMVGIDREGTGRIGGRAEEYSGSSSINIGGTVLKLQDVNIKKGVASFVPSSEKVAEIPLPPDLAVGKPALAFTAKTLEGNTVHFPEDYKGKIVMLDFWATWCGPCKGEIPYSTAAYAKYHKDGFDILGISLDQADMAEKLKTFTDANKMPWPQIYEGKFWDVSLVKQYAVEGIPFVLLVDGTTGKVLAVEDQLRGTALDATIKANLPKSDSAAAN